MAPVEANKEIIWMKNFIGELRIGQEEYRLYCDRQSVHPPSGECGVVKICHYVQIVRRNRRGYGLEGISAHTHNTSKNYT